jgi:hypothetical protein
LIYIYICIKRERVGKRERHDSVDKDIDKIRGRLGYGRCGSIDKDELGVTRERKKERRKEGNVRDFTNIHSFHPSKHLTTPLLLL